MSTQKTQRQPMSDRHKLIIIITAIILAAVIAVSVTLIVLLQPKDVTVEPNDPSSTVSSNLPVKNGDFGLVSSDDTTYPKSALNWTRYGYKAPSGSAHDFELIESSVDVVMGIIDTDEEEWQNVVNDLSNEHNVTLSANPSQHGLPDGEKHNNSKVYMIATKKATNASIMSDSVSVSATTSVKITVWVNTSQLTSGGATIMIQNSSSTPNAKEENRYAYKYNIEQKDGWQELNFYVFNRKTSTQYIRVNVGLGNVYTNEAADGANAEGVLYIDDIAYETVTADTYRQYADTADDNDTTYKIIEKEEETTVPKESKYLTLKDLNASEEKPLQYTDSADYVKDATYSPFTNKDDFYKIEGEGDEAKTVSTGFGIYKIVNDGTNAQPVALEFTKSITLQLDENDYTVQDYNHISFWVRTVSLNNNSLARASIAVERKNSDGDWERINKSDKEIDDFNFKTEQNIENDTNNGWVKYDIYLKPSRASTEVRIVFALGSVNGFKDSKFIPEGELYVTTPYFETISVTAYNSASSSTGTSKKFDLAGLTATTDITNGSFSSISANTQQPSNWTPVFAGQNVIYRDGKGDIAIDGLSIEKDAVAGSGIVHWQKEFTDYTDDAEGNILKLVSNKKSSYGYLSNEITATAHTVYVFSVLANTTKGQGTTSMPYVYLLESGVERDKAILAKVDNLYTNTTVNGDIFCQPGSETEGEGWIRYYIVYITGDKDTTVKLALFNGSIDGTHPAEAGSTIYYDKVAMQSVGSYSMAKDDENEEATEYIVKFSVDSGYSETALGDCENIEEVLTAITKVSEEITIKSPTEEEWTEMKTIPEAEDDEDEGTTETPATDRDVDLALLFSILSSVLLIAALAVVVVLKVFKKRKNA